MASTIKIKRSGVAGKQPNTATLSVGELAINYKDQKLFSSNGTAVFQIGGSSSGGLVSTTSKDFGSLKGTDTVITGVTAAVSTNYLQVANASATYATKAYAAANTYVKSVLANTNSYIATKLNSSTFNSALANTNTYIATRATWSALTATNTAIRTLVSDRLQVANAAATYQTKAVERAALANTNASIATQTSRITLVNTNLTGTNTALRTLISDRLQVANASATYQTKSVERAALANTNSYIATKVNTTTFNSALANTNSYIATQATRITLVNTNLTGTNTAIRALVSDRLQVANASATYLTKNNPVVTGTLTANGSTGTSGYYLRTSGTGVYWSPVAASGATWSALTTTNTALRTLISDRLQVANAASIYQTKAVERAALANTNSSIATQASRITLVNTNLTATNTAIRGLFSSYLTTSSASSTYQTQAGMSSYLTTSTASSTYAPLSGCTFSGDIRTYRTASTTTGVYYFSQSGDKYLYYDGANFTLNGGYVYNANSFRAPIFYDSDNTAYYVNPDSTSRLVNAKIDKSYYDSIVSQAVSTTGVWYTIAANGGDRASAKFVIVDKTSGLHQTLHFIATAHFGTDAAASITVLNNSFYNGPPITHIRVKEGGTYDGAVVQVYVNAALGDVSIYQVDNYQDSGGWVLKNWVNDNTNPGTVATWANLAERARVYLGRSATNGFMGNSNGILLGFDSANWLTQGSAGALRINNGNGYIDIGPMNSSYCHYYTDRPGNYWDKYGENVASWRAPIFYDSDDTSYYVNPNGYSSMYSMRLWGNELYIRGGSPTIHFQDTDQYSAALHNNSNLFYVLRGGVDDTSWSTVGSGWWPCYWNLTNNDCTMGGNISAAYNIVAYASDKRLKENIVEIPNALDKIKQIRGVTFDWNDDAEVLGFKPETKYNDLGVIAQEIQAVLPQAVKPAPFDQWFPDPSGDYEQEYLDQMMGTSRSGENYLTVQLDKIVPLLIEGIKEQQNQIEELLNRIKVLEQK